VVRRWKARLQKNVQSVQWYQTDAGFYYAHLKRYFDIFDPAQIRLHLYEDFKADPAGVLQDVYRFLPDTSIRHMVGGVPRNRIGHIFLVRLNSVKPVLKPLVPPMLRQHLVDYVSKL
jgi:hypothetical protein